MMLSISAPGKLVLLGEYAVLHGAPAIVVAIDRRVHVEISPRNGPSTLTLPQADLFHLPVQNDESGLLSPNHAPSPFTDQQAQFVLDITNRFRGMVDFGRSSPPSMDLLVDAESFFSSEGIKLGLGSSAAVTVALLAGLYAHTLGRRPERETLFKLSLSVHRYLQGDLGSGIDVAASVFGGALAYRLDTSPSETIPQLRPVDAPATLETMAVWTGHSASTTQMLSDLKRFGQHWPSAYFRVVDRLGDITEAGTNAFKQGDTAEFLSVVDRFYRQLIDFSEQSSLPIVTADDKFLAKIAQEHGGAYKPSGAGGGDIGLVFTNGKSALKNIVQAVSNAGYKILDLKWGEPGVVL